MTRFELSSSNSGRRKFKMVLHEIYPDTCIDKKNEAGTLYNRNGITWIRQYCEKQAESIKTMSLRAEFLDEERTELASHGDTGIEDGLPVFEDATVIGTFTDWSIEEVAVENRLITAMVGYGEIDAMCYPKLVKKLESDLNNGVNIDCSIEICRLEDRDAIGYLYGYKNEGRIPIDFQYSGCALLGVAPADPNAKMLELNEKEENHKMNEQEVQAMIDKAIGGYIKKSEQVQSEINQANEERDQAVSEKEECKKEKEKCETKANDLEKENKDLKERCAKLEKELAACKKSERCAKLEKALDTFTEEEKKYAEAEINSFNTKEFDHIPTDEEITVEINSIVTAIYSGVGKEIKKQSKKEAELNSLEDNNFDIFGDVDVPAEGDVNIF